MLLPVLIFLAVTVGLYAIWLWITPTGAQQRLQAISNPATKSDWVASVVNVVGPFAKLSTPDVGWEDSPLRIRFMNAGIRHPDARLVFFGLKTVLPVLFAALAYLYLEALAKLDVLSLTGAMLTVALIGCYIPNLVLWMTIRGRQREILENFPDATDLMLVCVEAGLGLDAALTRVTEEIRIKSVALAEELHLANLEMRAGARREQALRNLALRTGVEEIGIFSTMLVQADRFGTSIGESLRVFSDDLRHKRQTRAEEKAAKIPTKLLFPLVVFIFPSIIMVIMGPAVIRVWKVVLPLLSKGPVGG